MSHDICLNIHYSAPKEIWDKWHNELKAKLSEKPGYEIGVPEEGYKFKYRTPFEKNYSDIKTVDKGKIVFNDYSTFYWEDFSEGKKDMTAKRPYFAFSSPLIQLYIYFDDTGKFSKKKLKREFADFQLKLNNLGIRTLNL